MRVQHLQTSFTEADLIENSPFVAGLHKLRFEDGDFHEVMLGYHDSVTSVPFYTFTMSEMQFAINASEKVYDALYDAVGILLNHESINVISHFFGDTNESDNFIRSYPQFVEYAKHSYNKNHPAIYGRFDMAFHGIDNLKFYEFNGDTPTMLFESSCVQNVLAGKAGKLEDQHNWWQENFAANITKMVQPGAVMAVVAKMDITTDAMTAEYIYNTAIEAGIDCILMDFIDLEYDDIDKKFHYRGTIVDKVYILKPWEEMVEESPDIIGQWQLWPSTFSFFEPPWRWFTSNKGIWAYLYNLLTYIGHNDPIRMAFFDKHCGILPHLIPSHMETDKPLGMLDYIAKPVIGRCSGGLRVFKDGQSVYSTGGWYTQVKCIVQTWTPPPALTNRDQFVTCMWMAPYDFIHDPMAMTASLLTVRECKGDITNISNEAVYPCIMEED